MTPLHTLLITLGSLALITFLLLILSICRLAGLADERVERFHEKEQK